MLKIKPTILIVEDEELFRKSLGRLIDRLGYKAISVSNAEEALELTKNASFDLILTDIKLPGITGLELLKTIKQRSLNSIVIVITGYGNPDIAVKAIHCGADGYLLKPVRIEALKHTINQGIEKSCRLKNVSCN
ncbi:MAG TPA: response regulator [Nitrospinota bacterium]|nr:response regulator [Nitrospinota bacterium]